MIAVEGSLFDKYGGFSAVSKIVLRLYDRVLDDDDVGPFFDDVDMPRLIDHQTKFLSSLMGGPASFTDDHIERAHARYEIHDLHFDKLRGLIVETLEEFSLDPQDVAAIVAAFDARRGLLVKD